MDARSHQRQNDPQLLRPAGLIVGFSGGLRRPQPPGSQHLTFPAADAGEHTVALTIDDGLGGVHVVRTTVTVS